MKFWNSWTHKLPLITTLTFGENPDDYGQQEHKEELLSSQSHRWVVDKDICLAQAGALSHFELLQNPVGECNGALHVAGRPSHKNIGPEVYRD